MSNWRYTKNNSGVMRDGTFVLVGDDSPPWRDIVASGAPIDPYVPPPLPSPSELRQREYSRRVDFWTSGVMRYQVMLALIPDTPDNTVRRAGLQTKLAVARQTILELVTAIEAEHPDA